MSDEIKFNENVVDLRQDIIGTAYPYWNTKKTFGTAMLSKFRKAIAPYNPLQYNQMPSQSRDALTMRAGNRFFIPSPYPNSIVFGKGFPIHYDPLASTSFQKPNWHLETRPPQLDPHLKYEEAPRACYRTLKKFYICKEVNGDSLCQKEKLDIYQICPNFVLDGMKNVRKLFMKVDAQNAEKYHEVMQVSPYNKDRDVSMVSNKTWHHGSRKYLRPDTLYADERYTNISQAEINAAKARVAEREKAKHVAHEHHHESHQPSDQEQVRMPRKLYP